MDKMAKITINGVEDPLCPKCETPLFGVSAMKIGADKKFKHYGRCPECNFATEAE
jgi:uncharacterized protein with PIN domain